MNKNGTLIVVVALVVISIAAFVYYKSAYLPKYSWAVNYKRSSDQPYGLKLFYNTIKNQPHTTTIMYNHSNTDLRDTTLVNSNFISIGDDFYPDSISSDILLKFARNGNRVLIASNYSPLNILSRFVSKGDSISGFMEQRDSVVSLEFKGDSVPFQGRLKFHYQVLKDTAAYNWNIYRRSYLTDSLLADYNMVPFAFLNDSNINSFYLPVGKGRIIIHANPILFTNYYMASQNGFKHVSNVLSQLNAGPVFWYDNTADQTTNTSNNSDKSNPLKFLFSHPYLQWAWYLFLATVLLYLAFRSKREQRIIPLMPVNTNASIEYTKAIGTLYFKSKGHNRIATEMHIVFLADVRSRYNISTDIPEPELIEQLSARAEMDKTILYHLFRQFKYVRTDADANAHDLITLYNAIENYNKKRK